MNNRPPIHWHTEHRTMWRGHAPLALLRRSVAVKSQSEVQIAHSPSASDAFVAGPPGATPQKCPAIGSGGSWAKQSIPGRASQGRVNYQVLHRDFSRFQN